MKLENGMFSMDDRPMEMRSDEEIEAVANMATPEQRAQWRQEAIAIAKRLGIPYTESED